MKKKILAKLMDALTHVDWVRLPTIDTDTEANTNETFTVNFE